MELKGINIEHEKGLKVVNIEDFSIELQKLIREQLQSIYNGFSEVKELPKFYSYKKTLKSFLERYNSKSEETKKGMIGELLAHILINNYVQKLKCLSILKNKEERSIKKGFDIIYYQEGQRKIWYSEVKSGNKQKKKSPNYSTINLLKIAKASINDMFTGNRESLWESALIDASLVLDNSEESQSIRDLLTKDSPSEESSKKNVLLISVLYHSMTERCTLSEIKKFRKDLYDENLFEKILIFTIQKETYEKVENFLITEMNNEH